jgi:hypothetical protein
MALTAGAVITQGPQLLDNGDLLGNGCRVNDGGNATSTNIIIILQEHNSGFCHSLLISISFLKIQ